MYTLPELKRLGDVTAKQAAQSGLIMYKLDEVVGEVGRQAEIVESVSSLLSETRGDVDGINLNIKLDRYLMTCVLLAEKLEQDRAAIMHAAINGKLDGRALPPELLRGGLEELGKLAAEKGYKLVPRNPMEALQASATFATTDNGYDVMLHVPMRKGRDMKLYRLLRTPITSEDGLSYSLADAGGATYLAISGEEGDKERMFRTFTLSELNDCRKTNSRFFECDNVAHRVPARVGEEGEPLDVDVSNQSLID